MNLDTLITKHKALYKQRNFFLMMSCLLLITSTLISFKAFVTDVRTILVPGISETLEISNKNVSESYLRRASHMFLSLLLDLSPSDIEFKRDSILKLTASGSYNDISSYFNEQVEKMQKFKVSTYFTPKEMQIDAKNLKVIAKGIFTSRFGTNGQEEKDISFFMEFSYENGFLLIKRFKAEEAR
jgi:conjugal transfer pilus assembly protein TraE